MARHSTRSRVRVRRAVGATEIMNGEPAEEDMSNNELLPTIREDPEREAASRVDEEAPPLVREERPHDEIICDKTDWRSVAALNRIVVLHRFIMWLTPIHRNLKRENWIYLTGHVYIGCLLCAIHRFVTFPIVNIQVARLFDRTLGYGLNTMFDLVPSLVSAPDGNMLLHLSGWFHPSSDASFSTKLMASCALFYLRLHSYICKLISRLLNLYATAATVIHSFLNSNYKLEELPIEELPVAVLASVLAFFWRYPYNTLYSWLLHPTVVQPALWLKSTITSLDTLIQGENFEDTNIRSRRPIQSNKGPGLREYVSNTSLGMSLKEPIRRSSTEFESTRVSKKITEESRPKDLSEKKTTKAGKSASNGKEEVTPTKSDAVSLLTSPKIST